MNNFKKLKFSNIFSYGSNNELDLCSAQLTQIVGKNGHGKSSIALILEEGLFNTNSKSIKRSGVLNRHIEGAKGHIEVEFEQGKDTYLVVTNRGSTTTVKLFKNKVDISSHTATGTYKTIEHILGYDHKTFSQIVYQSSVSSLEFLTATDTARKNFLINLLNLSLYTRACDVFKSLGSDQNKLLDTVNSSINVVSTWLSKFEKEDLTLKMLEPLIELDKIKLDRILEIKGQLPGLISSNKKITSNNTYKQILENLGNPVNNFTKPDEDAAFQLKLELNLLQKELKDSSVVQTTPTKTCPTCKTVLDNTSTYEMYQTFAVQKPVLENAIRLKKVAIANLDTALEEYNSAETNVQEWEKYHALVDANLPTNLLDGKELETELNDLIGTVSTTETKNNNITKNNLLVAAHNSKVEVLLSQKDNMMLELGEYKTRLIEVNKSLATLQILIKTFSNTGLVAYKIECLVKDLEQLTNEYLATLADGRFQLSFVISSSDKLNVVITDNGVDVDINALSTGERARVNVATLLAIRKLMQALSNSRTNLLILDETVSNLDAYGKEKLIEVLLTEESLNTFIVAHDYTHPLLEQISVVKENNISRIEHDN